MEYNVTEEDLVNFLRNNLKIKIEETASPFLATNCKKYVVKLTLNTPQETTISSETLTIYEGQR